uniref:Ig-like domain-containing protein n=1 Tax=Sander lucioperca TaxID=283035 RepID=A0A8C9X3R1_SANLU
GVNITEVKRYITMLFVSGLISVCVSEFHTVEVQPAEQVTLMCSNFSSFITYMFWFRLDSRPNISRISSMWSSDSNASLYDGFQNGKFNMTSNTTTLFLNINHVDLSDSGLYFCGFYSDGNAIHLNVDGKIVITSVILSVFA